MEAINFKVASDEYQLLPHTGFDAIDLDRKVLGLIGKMARQGLDINDDVEAFALLANTLSELSTPDFKWLLQTTLSAVTVVWTDIVFQRTTTVIYGMDESVEQKECQCPGDRRFVNSGQ